MNEDSHLEAEYEDRTHVEDEPHGWPGSGDGSDDLADYNQNEADDYANEGADDSASDEVSCLGDE